MGIVKIQKREELAGEGGYTMRLPTGQYGVIYADPPWQYKMYSEAGHEKSPQAHYECMSLDELKAMRDDVVFATAQDAACIMWAVFPMLPQALELMEHWGFTYITGGSWNKLTATGKRCFGAGYILRGSSELFLIGRHGAPKIKNKATRNCLFTGDAPKNLNEIGIQLNSLRREHSRKPDEMILTIENLFHGPYLELFSRQQRNGWDCWGNEAQKFSRGAT